MNIPYLDHKCCLPHEYSRPQIGPMLSILGHQGIVFWMNLSTHQRWKFIKEKKEYLGRDLVFFLFFLVDIFFFFFLSQKCVFFIFFLKSFINSHLRVTYGVSHNILDIRNMGLSVHISQLKATFKERARNVRFSERFTFFIVSYKALFIQNLKHKRGDVNKKS